jgi:hypothetical protein
LTDGPTCSSLRRAAGEPLYGTASRVAAWLLLEQPGPWGIDAVRESRLDRALAAELTATAEAAGVRVLLLRRYGAGATVSRPVCFLAYTGVRTRFVEAMRLDDPRTLLDLDLARLRRGERLGFGRPVEGPLYLVCTNGKHDQCCATHGRPLAQALSVTFGDRAWECSHMGGDRFAGNLLCFPHGLYFGGVGPADGLRVASLYERGLLDLEHFRGRSSLPPAVQAAEHFVRLGHDLRGVDDLVAERVETAGPDQVTVTFAARPPARYRATVRTSHATAARRLTCRSVRSLHPPVYELVDLGAERAAG